MERLVFGRYAPTGLCAPIPKVALYSTLEVVTQFVRLLFGSVGEEGTIGVVIFDAMFMAVDAGWYLVLSCEL